MHLNHRLSPPSGRGVPPGRPGVPRPLRRVQAGAGRGGADAAGPGARRPRQGTHAPGLEEAHHAALQQRRRWDILYIR